MQVLPADFVPGADYTIGKGACAAQGGRSTIDGNGLTFCMRGELKAVFTCGDGAIVTLMQGRDGWLLQGPGGRIEAVEETPAASGMLVRGATLSLHSKGREALLTRPEGDISCRELR